MFSHTKDCRLELNQPQLGSGFETASSGLHNSHWDPQAPQEQGWNESCLRSSNGSRSFQFGLHPSLAACITHSRRERLTSKAENIHCIGMLSNISIYSAGLIENSSEFYDVSSLFYQIHHLFSRTSVLVRKFWVTTFYIFDILQLIIFISN